MSVEVLRPGVLTTIQDAGRPGFGKMGVGPGGVMDEFAFRIANLLVGNDPSVPALEFFHPGPELRFDEPSMVAITGPDGQAFADDKEVPFWRPIFIPAGTVLKLVSSAPGIGYLAIHSGWQSDHWLGSSATNLAVGLGGFKGRKLEKQDRFFPVKSSDRYAFVQREASPVILPWSIPEPILNEVYDTDRHILCLTAPETERLGAEAATCFVSSEFHLTKDCSRMGFRIHGSPIPTEHNAGILSSPVAQGTIQLLPDGQLIALRADHQTTGGYPRLAAIFRTEWPRFNRFLSGKGFYFMWGTPEMSILLLKDRTQMMARIGRSCILGFNSYIYHR